MGRNTVYHLKNQLPVLNEQTPLYPLLINQPMGIWDIYDPDLQNFQPDENGSLLCQGVKIVGAFHHEKIAKFDGKTLGVRLEVGKIAWKSANKMGI